MSSIFAKLSLFFASILGLVSAPAYIQLNTDKIVFNYKTGESRPLYYLNVKNIGPQKERFDVSVNVPWIFFSREGYDSVTSLNLEKESAVNFVLDIRPEMVVDGSHSSQITVQAADVYDYSVIETKTVKVTLNKNFVPIPTPSETAVPTLTVFPTVSLVVSPTQTVTPTPTPIPTVTLTPTRIPLEPAATKGGGMPLTGQASPKPSPSAVSPIILPTISPTATVSPTPFVSATTLLLPKSTVEAKPLRTKTLFLDLWQLIRNAFWPF